MATRHCIDYTGRDRSPDLPMERHLLAVTARSPLAHRRHLPLLLATGLCACTASPVRHAPATLAPAVFPADRPAAVGIDDDAEYRVKELPVQPTARIEEVGEQELRWRVRHDRSTTELALEGEYAPIDGLQVEVEVPYAIHHGATGDGVPALEFGARGSVLEDLRTLAVSIGAVVTAPVEDTQTEYELSALFARTFDDVELHGSLGIQWDAHDHAYPWSVAAVGGGHRDRVFPTLEVFGAGSDASIAPGLVVAVEHGMEFAVALPLRLAGDAESVGLFAGFLIEW